MVAYKVSIINMKGGVGKTTLSFHLAAYLSENKGYKVLLIDLDPQANATIVSTEPEKLDEHKKQKKTISDLFLNCFKQYGPFPKEEEAIDDYHNFLYEIYKSEDGKSRFDLIPSEIYLSTVLKGLHIGPYDLDRLLVKKAEKDYDFIIIDCAPTYSILTTLALNATKTILIPVMTDKYGLYGVELMKYIIEEHQEDYGIEIKTLGIIFTKYQKDDTSAIKLSNSIIKAWGKETFKTSIRNSKSYIVIDGKREAIFKKAYVRDEVRDEFENFVKEFEEKIQK